MSKPVHLLVMLEMLVPKRHRGLDTSVHFPSVPKLVHGECTSLETLGNYKLYCCRCSDGSAKKYRNKIKVQHACMQTKAGDDSMQQS